MAGALPSVGAYQLSVSVVNLDPAYINFQPSEQHWSGTISTVKKGNQFHLYFNLSVNMWFVGNQMSVFHPVQQQLAGFWNL